MKQKAVFCLTEQSYQLIYGPDERRDIAACVELLDPPLCATLAGDLHAALGEVEIIFSGWGMPCLTPEVLAALPRLRVIFYGSGSIRGFMTEAAWQRGIIVCSAWAANAIPVAEFTLASIIYALKGAWRHAFAAKKNGRLLSATDIPIAGTYQSVVGLVSLGMVGHRVRELLRALEVTVLAYDPFVTADEAAALGIRLVELDDLFCRADVVSLHTPLLPQTRSMIRGAHLAAMKPYATLINTARGGLIDEQEMIAVLQARPDLTAILDVTDPEPPLPASPLYRLPNVVLTPHIAGAVGSECRRMGRYMVEELRRYVAGVPLEWQISRERAALLA